MLSEEELVTSIKDKMPDFLIHVSDLKAPTGKFVQSYYVRILEELGVDVDALKEPSSEQLEELDYPDAYRHALPVTNLHGALSYVFEHIYVDVFSILDVTEPSPRRTQFLIKAMDGFHTFADWKAQSIQNNIAKLLQQKAEYDQLRAQCEGLKGEINIRASERAQRDVLKKELIIMSEETRKIILQLKKEDSEVREDIALSEAAFEKGKHKQGVLHAEYQKLEAEASKLQSQIVKSPVHLEAELNRLQEEKRKSESEKQQLAQVMQEKSRQKDLYEKFSRMQEECEVKLKDILTLHKCFKVVEKKQEEAQKKKQASTVEEQEITGKTQKLHTKIAQMQEQKMAFSMQWEKKKVALMQSIEEAKREQDNLKKKLDDVNSKVVEVRTERMQLEEKFISLRQLSEKQNTKYEELYAEKTAKQDACIKKIQDIQTKLIENIKKHS